MPERKAKAMFHKTCFILTLYKRRKSGLQSRNLSHTDSHSRVPQNESKFGQISLFITVGEIGVRGGESVGNVS